MDLRHLFADFPFPVQPSPPEVQISGLAFDSRRVQPGDLFVVLSGPPSDGHRYIPDAIARGAAAVVGSQEMSGLPVPYLQTPNSRQALTWLAAAYHDYPGRKLTVIGVTGTDGKTTTSNFLYQILRTAGIPAGMISTVNAVIGDEILDTGFHVTTPDAPDIQQYLARMVAAGLTHVVLETTSHGLAQFRADAALYDIAVFTNITHEHLNDHGSLENYRLAKARLIELLADTPTKAGQSIRLALLNADDSSHSFLSQVAAAVNRAAPSERQVKTADYGVNETSLMRAENIRCTAEGLRFEIASPNFRAAVASPLLGMFNVSNILAAFSAAVLGLGVDPQTAARGVTALGGVPGRMERIDLGQDFIAMVDFAHTPNALRVAIMTARSLTPRRVITVFGSAGLRDKEKRRMMAETSAEMADISILTAEDPRTESLDSILEEMAAGARSRGGVEGESFYRVADRGAALRLAVSLAQPGDIVLACGKGHEQSMCFGVVEYLWDDRTALHAALAEALQLPGPQMPLLPTSQSTP